MLTKAKKIPNIGELNGATQLTNEQALRIREMYDKGMRPQEIVDEFERGDVTISTETVRRIGRRVTWKWIDKEFDETRFLPPLPAAEVAASLARFNKLKAENDAKELLAKAPPEINARAQALLGKEDEEVARKRREAMFARIAAEEAAKKDEGKS